MAPFYLAILAILSPVVFAVQNAPESAWNGHTSPESTTPTQFTPYYVPPGAKSYDSASPLIQYTGKWNDQFSSSYVDHSMRQTNEKSASTIFSFTGTGVEWFGSMDRRHGLSDVFVDGKHLQQVDAHSDAAHKQQRVWWKFDLPFGKHTIRIVNTGKWSGKEEAGALLSIDAFVVTQGASPVSEKHGRSLGPAVLDVEFHQQEWTLTQAGSTGVHAMQLAVISDTHALIVDKVEHNPLTINGHPAWGALYNLKTHAVKPLSMQSNSFCAGGTFLSNGTMVNVGGNPVVDIFTSSADFGDLDGLQAVRLFHPCDSESGNDCEIYENHERIRMASPRWYNTVLRISDGSAMIIGGSRKGGWINNATVNNPTIEYYPPKSIHNSNGLPIGMQFLQDTLNSNLFPIAFSLPDGRIFMAANNDAMIYNWEENTEQRLPSIPNGVRVTYPMAGTALLLPLSPENSYEPVVLICGGSAIDDKTPGYEISSQEPASSQCVRMTLTEGGISAGWEVEQMPHARTMPDAVLLPTGEVLIVNGAGTGISGYGNVKEQVGMSNADHPVLTPVVYDPRKPAGDRFSSDGIPTSRIPRMYHSVATLTPGGAVMIAGSNPNLDRSAMRYGTEYRVEWLSPPYMHSKRPVIEGKLKKLGFGKNIEVKVKLPSKTKKEDVKVVLMDLGFVTHAVHANSRMVYLDHDLATDGASSVQITGPPDGKIYPPGPAWLYIVVDGVPSEGRKIMVGHGESPPVDQGAIDNMLRKTIVDQYEASRLKNVKDHDDAE